jgi:hypothetical protein
VNLTRELIESPILEIRELLRNLRDADEDAWAWQASRRDIIICVLNPARVNDIWHRVIRCRAALVDETRRILRAIEAPQTCAEGPNAVVVLGSAY